MSKRKSLIFQQASKAIKDFALMRVERTTVSLDAAMDLSCKLNIYAYDAYMLAVAIENDCALLTLDGGLRHAARQAGVRLVEVTP